MERFVSERADLKIGPYNSPTISEENMPNYWFFLSDPEDYHLDELFKKKKDVWDGVHGSMAQKYIGEMKKGDVIIGYHTAPEKSAYAVLEAVSDPYQNPEEKGKNWVLELRGVEKFKQPVPLADLKIHAKTKGMKLFKIFRPIAVSPLTPEEFAQICKMGGLK
ncbi:MAG: EVE domain-containing protein [Acidobacteria bacterium]|nr:EVE domain-containing protein [Acidobacteriota bacterium]